MNLPLWSFTVHFLAYFLASVALCLLARLNKKDTLEGVFMRCGLFEKLPIICCLSIVCSYNTID